MVEVRSDGRAVPDEPPYGCCVVVYRRFISGLHFLILHRAQAGPDFDGEWAWTPPSGGRWPGEPPIDCAIRELGEETGLVLALELTEYGTESVHVFVAEAAPDAEIVLSAEHDRFEWATLEVATTRCLPDVVAEQIRAVAELFLGGAAPR